MTSCVEKGQNGIETEMNCKAWRKRESKNKKQETPNKTVWHIRGLSSVSLRNKKRKTLLDSRIMFLAEHVRNTQSTIYLKSHGCVHGLHNDVSLCAIHKYFTSRCKTG